MNKINQFGAKSELSEVLIRFKREFIWVGLFSLLANLLMLTPTIYMLQVYDRVLVSQNELTLFFLTFIVVIFYIVMAFSEWLRSRLLVRSGMRFDKELSSRIFNASFEANLRLNQNNPIDAFSNLANLRQFLTGNGIIVFFDAPWTPIYIAVTFMLHPILGLLSILFSFIQLWLAFWSHRDSRDATSDLNLIEGKSRAFLQRKLKNAEPVEAMGMLKNLRIRWLKIHEDHQKKLAISSNRQNRQQAIVKFIRYSMQSLTLGIAALLVVKGELSGGAMIAANVLVSRALQPLDLIVSSWRGVIQAKDAYKNLDQILTDYPEKNQSINNYIPQGDVLLNNLSAYKPDKESAILNNLNVHFKAGQITAIIGPSGSGKSTLARCLVGVWPDLSGEVLIDKISVKEWNRSELGPHIGYLPQDIELFDGTVAENICRFYEVNSDLVIEAAKKAGIHDMILRFPNGYDTRLGEAAGQISGGQRQRIALARAIYGNPQFIVLDEPNANLDDLGERALVGALSELKAQGKTVFLITHRLNILGIADYLLIMREGKIDHYGPRDEVLSKLKKEISSK